MIVLLWLGFIFIPLIIGEGLLSVFYGKNRRDYSGLTEGYMLGGIVCIGVTEVMHIAGLFLNMPISKIGTWLLLALIGLALIAFLVIIVPLLKRKESEWQKMACEKTVFPFAFMVVVLLQALFIFCREPIMIPGDIILETVRSFLAEDGIYRVMPLTGMVSEAGVPLRYKILCLPTLYAVLCDVFNIEASLLVCHIVPIVVLAGTYVSYYCLSGVLFSKKDLKRRYMFLFVIAVFFLFTDKGTFMNGYGLLHGGYLGTTIRNLILVPYTLAASLEKRWWKVVLCVLAEACIAWTLWGLGVCIVISLGIGGLALLERKCPGACKFMQIFREKEDLT